MSMNHLLLGKSAIVSARGRRLGPPQGSIPPTRVTKSSKPKTPTPTKTETIQWKDADCRKNDARRDSLKWKDIKQDFTRSEDDEDLDDDNKLVSESEANEIAQGSLKTRRKSESSSYSEGSESSTSTSLCDEQNRMSDFDSEPASISDMTNLIDVSDSSPTKEFLDGNTSQIPITSEAGAAEIGSCVQEFKDFLDKKNNMENGRGLICVLPDLEINNEENDKSSIQEDITSNQEEETHRTIDTFDDFVDSNRGKTLRNYLDEFRKADIAKSEVTWDTTKPLHVDIHDVSVMSETHDTYSPSILSDILNLDETNKTSENFDEPDRKSIGSTSDNRPDSCDRSISSSISSISPVLKNSPAYIDEKMTYSCYKSPLRTDSGLAIELAQDEKPLEFKIDKYFEHSPEFFGARKYGSYLSSDDEEERREVAELSKRRYQSPAAMYITRPTETKKTTHWSENEIREEPIDPDIKNAEQGSRYSIDLSPNQHEMEKFKCDVKDTYELYRVTSKYIPKDTTSPPTSAESTHSLTDLINKFKNKADSFDNSSTDDTKKHSLLGKTKSEELTVDQKRAFSIIDDDIEEIRIQSGRRNSERALKIIQENSKILNRILVNQGNKSNNKNTLVEESIQEDFSKENRFRLRLSEGSQKSLPSPRSSSLDDYVPPKTEYYSQRSLDFSINYPDRDTALKTQLKAVDPIMKTSLLSPVFSPAEDKKYSGLGTSSMYTKDSPQDKGTSELHPKFFRVSETTALHSTQTILDENKTDMFGWENKGFDVNQHLPSSVEKITPISPSTEKISYDFHLENIVHDSLVFEKPKSPLRLELSLPKQESDDSWYKRYRTSESPDKNSTLTAVSETVLEPIESSTKETGESWKLESYTRYSDSYNISSPTKLKSNETSYGIDSSLRNIKKFGDSPISRLTDSFSKISECSPVENAPLKSETNKFETSQSSDLCVMSSSMSFSFDPSNEEHTSTKPGTFNSSDTLCQLTSLDQVSTPISPKVNECM